MQTFVGIFAFGKVVSQFQSEVSLRLSVRGAASVAQGRWYLSDQRWGVGRPHAPRTDPKALGTSRLVYIPQVLCTHQCVG